jgi:hypothetical protein
MNIKVVNKGNLFFLISILKITENNGIRKLISFQKGRKFKEIIKKF